MKLPPAVHRWSMSPSRAVRLQERLAGGVITAPLPASLRLVAGLDLAFSVDGGRCVAGAVVCELATLEVVETSVAWRPVRFPYVPGLLSFREAPAVLAAIRRLRLEPDVFIFDAQGLAHPRRFGLASHAGLLMDRPSIGCAKSRLCGAHDEPAPAAGSWTPLMHNGQRVGAALRTRPNVKPVYVSIGHRATLETAISLVLRCVTSYRLPAPTRLAHLLVSRERMIPPIRPG